MLLKFSRKHEVHNNNIISLDDFFEASGSSKKTTTTNNTIHEAGQQKNLCVISRRPDIKVRDVYIRSVGTLTDLVKLGVRLLLVVHYLTSSQQNILTKRGQTIWPTIYTHL